MKKLAVVGAYGAGKTSLIHAFGRLDRFGLMPAVRGTPMRDPAGSTPRPLEEATEAQLVQLVTRRYVERAVGEAAHPDGFLSDGSLLHEWVYATVRLAVGMHPEAEVQPVMKRADGGHRARGGTAVHAEVLEEIGHEIRQRALATYDAFVHLPIEFPLNDPVKPISEHFRVLSDRLLLEHLHDSGATVHTLSGPLEKRVMGLADIVGYPVSAISPAAYFSPSATDGTS
jgi:hypothetical protein